MDATSVVQIGEKKHQAQDCPARCGKECNFEAGVTPQRACISKSCSRFAPPHCPQKSGRGRYRAKPRRHRHRQVGCPSLSPHHTVHVYYAADMVPLSTFPISVNQACRSIPFTVIAVMPNRAIEIHDSVLAEASFSQSEAQLPFLIGVYTPERRCAAP